MCPYNKRTQLPIVKVCASDLGVHPPSRCMILEKGVQVIQCKILSRRYRFFLLMNRENPAVNVFSRCMRELTGILQVHSTWVSESLYIFVTHHSTPGTSSWDPGQTTSSSIDNTLMIPADIVTIGSVLSLYVTGSCLNKNNKKEGQSAHRMIIVLIWRGFSESN